MNCASLVTFQSSLISSKTLFAQLSLAPRISYNTPMTPDLSKRVALVTGASRGLGAAMARSLGAAGASVAVNYFGNPDGAARVCEEITKAGGKAAAFKADVREETEIRRMVGEIEKRFGTIDILVPNATGPQPFIKIEDLTWRACLDQLDFFVKSPLLLV